MIGRELIKAIWDHRFDANEIDSRYATALFQLKLMRKLFFIAHINKQYEDFSGLATATLSIQKAPTS